MDKKIEYEDNKLMKILVTNCILEQINELQKMLI